MAEELRDPPIIDPPIRLAVCVSGEGNHAPELDRPDPVAASCGRRSSRSWPAGRGSEPSPGRKLPAFHWPWPATTPRSKTEFSDVGLRPDPPQ